MLSVLRDGYHIPFLDSPPPLARTPISFPMYQSGSPRPLVLGQVISKMLSKDALEIVLDPGPGFYSRLFLVEKAMGGWRPVIDLSHLNGFVQQTPIKMETVASVLLFVREGDFLASTNLKDAYFQIPVHQASRKLLRFLSGEVVYQFKALCFGLSTTPQVFTRVFAAVSAWARSHGIRLLRYLDDWLILASSEAVAKKNIQDLLSLCHFLGIVTNEEKSDLVPSQTANYLGMTIDTGAGRIFPALARVEKFLSVAESFRALSAPPGSALAGAFGAPGFTGEASSLQSCSNALSAVAFADALVSRVGSSLAPGAIVPGGAGGSVLVDGAVPSSQGGSIRDTCSRSTPVFGRISVGVGCTPPRSCRVRCVVGAGEVAAHQSSRDEGNVFGIAVISGGGHRSSCDRDVRQLDGYGLSTSRAGWCPVPSARWPVAF